MKHLDDGTLQAFLDDELRPDERAEAAEHLLGCPRCRGAKDELAQAHAVFSEAVSVLDVEAPDRDPPAEIRKTGTAARSFARAAGLVLLLAAAAAAAVPGSPVREWIRGTADEEPVEAPAPEAVPPDPASVTPVGVSLDAAQPVDVILTGLERTTVRLVKGTGEGVRVTAVGADTDPAFRTATGTIEVRDGVGGEIHVRWPTSLETARLVVNGELYAEQTGQELRVHVPAQAADGTGTWTWVLSPG